MHIAVLGGQVEEGSGVGEESFVAFEVVLPFATEVEEGVGRDFEEPGANLLHLLLRLLQLLFDHTQQLP